MGPLANGRQPLAAACWPLATGSRPADLPFLSPLNGLQKFREIIFFFILLHEAAVCYMRLLPTGSPAGRRADALWQAGGPTGRRADALWHWHAGTQTTRAGAQPAGAR